MNVLLSQQMRAAIAVVTGEKTSDEAIKSTGRVIAKHLRAGAGHLDAHGRPLGPEGTLIEADGIIQQIRRRNFLQESSKDIPLSSALSEELASLNEALVVDPLPTDLVGQVVVPAVESFRRQRNEMDTSVQHATAHILSLLGEKTTPPYVVSQLETSLFQLLDRTEPLSWPVTEQVQRVLTSYLLQSENNTIATRVEGRWNSGSQDTQEVLEVVASSRAVMNPEFMQNIPEAIRQEIVLVADDQLASAYWEMHDFRRNLPESLPQIANLTGDERQEAIDFLGRASFHIQDVVIRRAAMRAAWLNPEIEQWQKGRANAAESDQIPFPDATLIGASLIEAFDANPTREDVRTVLMKSGLTPEEVSLFNTRRLTEAEQQVFAILKTSLIGEVVKLPTSADLLVTYLVLPDRTANGAIGKESPKAMAKRIEAEQKDVLDLARKLNPVLSNPEHIRKPLLRYVPRREELGDPTIYSVQTELLSSVAKLYWRNVATQFLHENELRKWENPSDALVQHAIAGSLGTDQREDPESAFEEKKFWGSFVARLAESLPADQIEAMLPKIIAIGRDLGLNLRTITSGMVEYWESPDVSAKAAASTTRNAVQRSLLGYALASAQQTPESLGSSKYSWADVVEPATLRRLRTLETGKVEEEVARREVERQDVALERLHVSPEQERILTHRDQLIEYWKKFYQVEKNSEIIELPDLSATDEQLAEMLANGYVAVCVPEGAKNISDLAGFEKLSPVLLDGFGAMVRDVRLINNPVESGWMYVDIGPNRLPSGSVELASIEERPDQGIGLTANVYVAIVGGLGNLGINIDQGVLTPMLSTQTTEGRPVYAGTTKDGRLVMRWNLDHLSSQITYPRGLVKIQ